MTGAGSRIPMLDLRPVIDESWVELRDATERVLRSGRFILGPEVEALESEVASYIGAAHAVGVNSGTDALVIGLRALGVGPGDEVITSPFTFFATPESISNVGATPVFVDIDPVTFNLDPDRLVAAITERTKAIVPVHLFGHACDMDGIGVVAREHDLFVIEDVAQAMGGRWRGVRLGAIGQLGALSFFPSKNLGGFGDGGMIVTNDAGTAETARMLRAHGSRRRYENETLGYNSRLDEMQAALLRVMLPHLDRHNDARRQVASWYGALLHDVEDVVVPTEGRGTHHVYHQYTVRVIDGRRDVVKKALDVAGIATAIHYTVPAHRLPVYDGSGQLPVAEAAATEVLSLPMGPTLDEATVAIVVGSFP